MAGSLLKGKNINWLNKKKIEIYSDKEFEKYMQLKIKKWNMINEAEKMKIKV